MHRRLRCVALGVQAALFAALPAAAAPEPGRAVIPAPSPFPEGCFPGSRDGPIYEVDLEAPAGVDLMRLPGALAAAGHGGARRLVYPAACDAGNAAKAPYRRRSTAYLHADIEEGRCRSFEDWVSVDPWSDRRFYLHLTTARARRDLGGLLTDRAPDAARRAGAAGMWTAGPADAQGLAAVDFPGFNDIYDRWVGRTKTGAVAELLMCRKEGAIARPGCEHSFIFEGARITLSYQRRWLHRLRDIQTKGLKLLGCALGRPP